MTPNERKRLGHELDAVRARDRARRASRKADAQALADVRTLDEWAKQGPRQYHPYCYGEDCWEVELHHRAEIIGIWSGETPDAARHAAAEWVRAQARAGDECGCPDAYQGGHRPTCAVLGRGTPVTHDPSKCECYKTGGYCAACHAALSTGQPSKGSE